MPRIDDATIAARLKTSRVPTRSAPVSQKAAFRTRLRNEFAHVLGDVEEPDVRDVRAAFTQGIGTVKELATTGKIDPETADKLTRTLTILYANAIITEFSKNLLGVQYHRASPAFLEWLVETLR